MRYPCPCCGYYTYTNSPKTDYGFICPVCFWENDKLTNENEPSELNHGLTLKDGRFNYQNLGTCDPRMKTYVRSPKPEELPENN